MGEAVFGALFFLLLGISGTIGVFLEQSDVVWLCGYIGTAVGLRESRLVINENQVTAPLLKFLPFLQLHLLGISCYSGSVRNEEGMEAELLTARSHVSWAAFILFCFPTENPFLVKGS